LEAEVDPKSAGEGLRVMNLYCRGSNLKNLDEGRDKSDTFVILYMKWQSDQDKWLEVDQTEVVFDSLDPAYEHKFSVVFNLGQSLQLRFEVHDKDVDGGSQMIGYIETTLTELIQQDSLIQRDL
jgi:Ca2+-dependent lipid-binding protein